MYQTETHICAIPHCGKPQQHVTICHTHVEEAERELQQFSTEEILRLYAIARGEEKSAERVARKTMNQATTEDVLDLATYDLAQNITHHWPALLPYMAAHPDGAQLYWKIMAGCQIAQTKINGDDKEYKKEEWEDAQKKVRYPMTADEIIDYMQKYFGITITHYQLRHWSSRKKLDPIKTPGKQHNMYTPKQVLDAMG